LGLALPFGLFTGCTQPTGNALGTASKGVTVSFPPFNIADNPTEIDFTPVLTPDGAVWGVFSEAEARSNITLTITDDKGNANDKFPEGKVKWSDVNFLYSQSNWPWLPPLFTITLSDGNGIIYQNKFFICDTVTTNGYFDAVAADDGTTPGSPDGSDTQFTNGIVPTTPITFTLSKEVTE
jgi:hypothetical protein